MIDPSAPADIIALAEERSRARTERDYERADELKSRLEAAGWRVIDEGAAFSLEPAATADTVEDGHTVYGSIDSVPRRSEVAAMTASVIVIDPTMPDAALQALATHRPTDTQIVVVAARSVSLEGPADEIVRTVEPWSAGDALEAGIRRAAGTIIIVLDPGRVPTGDVVGPLVDALADPGVAVAGNEGLASGDLHRYEALSASEVTTIASGCYAFRRDDVLARGPVDGRLRLARSVAVWLGLVLRDEGPDTSPRRALVVDLPLLATEENAGDHDQARAARRDGYRISDRFRGHTWLGREQPPEGRVVGDGTEDHGHGDEADQGTHTGIAD